MKRLFSAGFSLVVAFAVFAPNAALAEDAKKDPDQIGNRNVSGNVNFYSLEKEIAIGKGLAQQVEKQAKIINDPIISEYVNRVGQNLVRNSDAKVPFTIKVIDSEEVNAFALPGQFRLDPEGRQRGGTRRRDGARDRACSGAPRNAPGHSRRDRSTGHNSSGHFDLWHLDRLRDL